MSGVLLGLVVGILSGAITIVLLQMLPPRYRWSKDISWTCGEPSGLAIHQVKIGRPRRRRWRTRRSPIDVSLRARVAVTGIGHKPKAAKIVDIPVDKSSRPVLGQSVLVKLLVEECQERELRYFPDEVKRKWAERTLRLDDLLKVGTAELRVYALAYRPYVGTRWIRRGTYTLGAIKPGVFKRMEIDPPPDGKPPKRPDFLPSAPSTLPTTTAAVDAAAPPPVASLTAGRWTILVTRRRRGA